MRETDRHTTLPETPNMDPTGRSQSAWSQNPSSMDLGAKSTLRHVDPQIEAIVREDIETHRDLWTALANS